MAEWAQCTHMDGTPAMDQWARVGNWLLSVTPLEAGRWAWYANQDRGANLHGEAPDEAAAKGMAEAVALNVNTQPGDSYDPGIV